MQELTIAAASAAALASIAPKRGASLHGYHPLNITGRSASIRRNTSTICFGY
jgi:hypothetical protein